MTHINYLKSLLKHKWYVFQAGQRLGLPWWRLVVHDWQKFTPSEFPHYAKYFWGGKLNPDEFMYAWLHHVRFGKHHWEHWLLNPDYNFNTAINGALPMPESYVREMVADWLGASKAYTNSWNMSTWLVKNLPNIKQNLHPESIIYLDNILQELGYTETWLKFS